MSERGAGAGAAGTLAWHFLASDRRMQHPPHTLVEAGKTYRATGPLKLCENGMHASVRPIDALRYAPGPVVCRVRLSGEIADGGDKRCARERTALWMADASGALHEFACRCAERALASERAAGREPDPRGAAAIAAKRAWLRGEVDDAALADAADAACAAADRAAWAAADPAAAWAAERGAQDAELTALLLALAPGEFAEQGGEP